MVIELTKRKTERAKRAKDARGCGWEGGLLQKDMFKGGEVWRKVFQTKLFSLLSHKVLPSSCCVSSLIGSFSIDDGNCSDVSLK